jgi:hypothetical protein
MAYTVGKKSFIANIFKLETALAARAVLWKAHLRLFKCSVWIACDLKVYVNFQFED